MSCTYSINGTIELNDEDCEAALDALEKGEAPYAESVEFNRVERTLGVYVYGDMDSSNACAWDDAISAFAAVYAAKSAALETVRDGERNKLFVGPAGFDMRQAMIDDLDAQIEELQTERQRLINEREEQQ